jgi:two-component system, NtrC family, response regulator GlrR
MWWKRAVTLCDGPVIRARDLLLPQEQSPDQLSFREAKAQIVNEFEREYLVRLLRACGGNVSEAAPSRG